MKESDLRKWHRNLGMLLFIFIILQAGSGLFITFTNLSVPHTHAHGNAPGPMENGETEKSISHSSRAPEGAEVQPDSHPAENSLQKETRGSEHTPEHKDSRQPKKSGWALSIKSIHHGGGTVGTLYRLIPGVGLLAMAVSGSMIFFRVRARLKKSQI